MANTITVNTLLSAVTNGGLASVQRQLSAQFAMAGNLVSSGIVNIATSDTQFPIASLGGGTIGMLLIHNTDPTNYMTLGADGSHYPILINPNGWCLTAWNGAAVHGIANTAGVNAEYYILQA